MILKDFRSHARGIDDLLLYALYLEDRGVVLQKDGSFLASWRYAGPDMSAASHVELAALAAQVNRAFLRLGDGWMVQVDCVRGESSGYPEPGAFPDPTTRLVDTERRQQYTMAGSHYESETVLSVTYLPPPEVASRAAAFFVEGEDREPVSWSHVLDAFSAELDTFEDALSARLALARLDRDEQLSFLHYCVTGLRQPIALPEGGCFLDQVLATQDLVGGLRPRIGAQHLRTVALSGFPATSHPGITDFLNALPLEYRLSLRFIPLDSATAQRHLERHRTHWFQKRRGLMAMLRDMVSRDGTPETFSNQDAVDMAQDADDARAEASGGLVRYGYYTAVILLYGEDAHRVEQAAREVIKVCMNHGFGAQVETLNAVEAYLGSLPGHGYPNVRRPLLHTLNFADLMPLTSVWAGHEHNPCSYYPPASPPLLLANTSGTTPFRLNLHCESVGHTLVAGSTGSGKSVLLNAIAAQFLRYEGAQVFFFDKGYSSYVLARAVAADYYDIASERRDETCFHPLGAIEGEAERRWAEEWMAELLALQQVELTPARLREIHEAMRRLAGSDHRTLTDFQMTLQDPDLRAAVQFYTLAGAMGTLLDSDTDALRRGHYQVFEMENLMRQGERSVLPVLLYLFHRIEQRLDGRPTLVILDEAWVMLGHALFAAKLEEWLRVLRKRNAAVVLATQTLAEIVESPLRNVILESCVTKVFLPNPEAGRTEVSRASYLAAGLSDREIEIVAGSVPRRDYYLASRDGRRLIDLGLGPVALAFVGMAGEKTMNRVDELEAHFGTGWPAAWLREQGLGEWADRWEAEHERSMRHAV